MIARPSGKMVISYGRQKKRKPNSLARTSPSGASLTFQVEQINRAGALVNLHGVPAAKADRGPAFAIQIREITQAAGRTLRIASRQRDLTDTAVPHIERRQARYERTGGQPLQCVRRLDRSDSGRNGIQHARRFTGRLGSRRAVPDTRSESRRYAPASPA